MEYLEHCQSNAEIDDQLLSHWMIKFLGAELSVVRVFRTGEVFS